MACIYRVYNIEDNTSYIGQTKQPLKSRFRDHVRKALYKAKKNKLSEAIRKYGTDCFRIEMLYWVSPFEVDFDISNPDLLQKHLDEKEKEFIKKYNSIEEGYNTTTGGRGTISSYRLSPEEKELRKIEQKIRYKAKRQKDKQENPEKYREWARKRYHQNREHILELRKADHIVLARRERVRKHRSTLEYKAKRKAYRSTPEYKAKKRLKSQRKREALK